MCKFCRTQWRNDSSTETENRCAAQTPLLIEERTAHAFGMDCMTLNLKCVVYRVLKQMVHVKLNNNKNNQPFNLSGFKLVNLFLGKLGAKRRD